MRNSREQTAATRALIVETAARLFRERGINGIGVADLMSAAGLTHGGFYKHFESKEALVAAACEAALASTRSELERKAQGAANKDAVEVMVGAYLTQAHCEQPGKGCAIAALGPEAVRGDGLAKAALDAGVGKLLEHVRDQLTRSGVGDAESKAHGVLAALVGGLVLARAMQSPDRARAVLRDTRAFILGGVGATEAGCQ